MNQHLKHILSFSYDQHTCTALLWVGAKCSLISLLQELKYSSPCFRLRFEISSLFREPQEMRVVWSSVKSETPCSWLLLLLPLRPFQFSLPIQTYPAPSSAHNGRFPKAIWTLPSTEGGWYQGGASLRAVQSWQKDLPPGQNGWAPPRPGLLPAEAAETLPGSSFSSSSSSGAQRIQKAPLSLLSQRPALLGFLEAWH